jgi:uncharacterized membrane protein YbhN (UPF0104 family)
MGETAGMERDPGIAGTGASAPGDGRPRVGPLRVAAGFALTVLVGVGVALLVSRAAGFAEVADSLRGADPAWLALCFGAEVVSFAGYTAAFHEAVRFGGGPAIGRGATVRLVFASTGATRIVAAGGVGGLAVIYWALRQGGEPKPRALVRVLGFNTLLYGVFGALAFAAGLICLAGVGDAPAGMAGAWVGVVGLCLAGAVWVTRPARLERLSTVAPDAGPARRGLGLAVAGVDMVRQMASVRRVRAVAVAGAAGWWLGDIACLWAGLRAFDVHVGLADLVLVYATGYAATLLPLPTGGVGGVDAAMTFALTVLGVSLADALLGVVAYRLFAFWIPTIPALVALAGLPRLGRRLRQAAPGDAVGPEPTGAPAA